METNNIFLAAFLLTHNVNVERKGNAFVCKIKKTDPLVKQFESEDGYNTNIARLSLAIATLSLLTDTEES